MNGIQGIGIDIVQHDRFRSAQERWGESFIRRLFHASEIEYCESKAHSWQHFAGRFAVKEAVSKALGTGIGEKLSWLDMRVLRNESGAPYLELAEKQGLPPSSRVLISFSHSRDYSIAQAIVLAEELTGDL